MTELVILLLAVGADNFVTVIVDVVEFEHFVVGSVYDNVNTFAPLFASAGLNILDVTPVPVKVAPVAGMSVSVIGLSSPHAFVGAFIETVGNALIVSITFSAGP